jgi:hypothetical protein
MSEIISLHASQTDDDDDNFISRLVNRCCPNDEQIDSNDVDIQNRNKSRYKTGGFTQFRWLIWRNFVDVFKNPFEIRLRIILAIVCFRIIIIYIILYFYLIVSWCSYRSFLSSSSL